MKRSPLRPGKRCPHCKGDGCAECYGRGFILPAKKLPKPMARKAISKKPKTKRHAANLEYSRLRAAFMAANPRCVVLKPNGKPCGQPSTECHHRKGRGRFYLDAKTFLGCCSFHHQWIHENAGLARQLGYLQSPTSIQPLPPIVTADDLKKIMDILVASASIEACRSLKILGKLQSPSGNP